MRRWLASALPIMLFAAPGVHAEPLASIPGRGLPQGQWSASAASKMPLRIKLARADVTFVRSTDGRISVRIVAEGTADDAARLWIDETQMNGSYVLTDRFPRRSVFAFPNECLPPPDERGDIWSIATRLHVIVAAPRGYHPQITVGDGTINGRREEGH